MSKKEQNEMSVRKSFVRRLFLLLVIMLALGSILIFGMLYQAVLGELTDKSYEEVVESKDLKPKITISQPGTLILGSADIPRLKDVIKESIDAPIEETTITKKIGDFITIAMISLEGAEKMSGVLTEVSFNAVRIKVPKKSSIKLERNKPYYILWEPELVLSKK